LSVFGGVELLLEKATKEGDGSKTENGNEGRYPLPAEGKAKRCDSGGGFRNREGETHATRGHLSRPGVYSKGVESLARGNL